MLAVNQNGEGAVSSDLSATPTGVADPPVSVAVTPTSSGVDVSWVASPDDEGSAITGYKVQIFDSSNTQVGSTVTVSSSSALTHSVTSGLSVGATYSAKVITVNAVGDSNARTSSFVVVGRPSAPLNVTAEPRISGAYIEWDTPTYTGGASLAAYLIRVYSNNHSDGDTPLSTVTVTSGRSATITGLTDGTDYDITVLGAQDAGASLVGLESTSVDVRPGRPDVPSGLSLTPGNLSLNASWTASRSISGLDPTHYQISATHAGGTVTSTVSAASVCAGTACTASISGLTNGTAYSVSILASLSSQLSPGSTAVSETPRTTPGAPSNSALAASDASLTLSWEPPASTGGASIQSYSISVTDSDSADVFSVTIDQAARSYDIPGLTNGETYTASISANNVAGSGTAATASAVPLGTPTSPQSLTIEPRASSLVANWTAPADLGGSAVQSYGLEVTNSSTGVVTSYNTSTTSQCSTTSTSLSCVVALYDDDGDELDTEVVTPTDRVSLPANTSFTVKVKATNAQGDSAWTSSETSATTGQPSVPRNVVITQQNAGYTVCLLEPEFVLSSSITRYQVNATDGQGQLFTNIVSATDFATSALCQSPKIAYSVFEFDDSSTPINGTSYSITVAATIEATNSDPVWGIASEAASVTPRTVPSTPRSSNSNPGDGQVSLSWLAPSSDGGSAITGYTITYRAVNTSDLSTHSPAISASSSSATISSLTNGTEYEFFIYAENAAGSSAYSRVTGTPARSISSGSTSNGQTTAATSKQQQTVPSIPTTMKKGKKVKIQNKTSAGLTFSLVSRSKSCSVSRIITTKKTKVGKKIVKTKTQTGWLITARKKPSCLLQISNSGDSTYAELSKTHSITVK